MRGSFSFLMCTLLRSPSILLPSFIDFFYILASYKSKLLLRSSWRSSSIPGGNRGSSPSAMYPARIVATVTKGNRTERHFYALFRVEDDCRAILATVTSEHDVDQTILTLYGILDNGTGGAG
jgi:hypothetical protein